MDSLTPAGAVDQAPAVPLPIGAAFDHVAVAAPRIRTLLPIYLDLLGGEFVLGGDNLRVGYRGLQLKYRGGGKVELLEPLEGSSFLDSFFRRSPLGGLHHVTFTVPSIADALLAIELQGYQVHGASHADPTWSEVFIHPKDAHGTLLQLAQPGPGYGEVGFGLADVLAGNGSNGCGKPSP